MVPYLMLAALFALPMMLLLAALLSLLVAGLSLLAALGALAWRVWPLAVVVPPVWFLATEGLGAAMLAAPFCGVFGWAMHRYRQEQLLNGGPGGDCPIGGFLGTLRTYDNGKRHEQSG